MGAAILVVLLVLPGNGRRATARSAVAQPRRSLPVAPHRAPSGPSDLDRAQLATIHRLIALGRPIYCGGARGHDVALTFDDGPGVYTHLALRKLRAAHAQATFFVVGKSIVAWPGYLRPESRIAALGDHTFTHRDLVTLPPAVAAAEVADTKAMIERATRRPVLLFRPPYGAHDAAVDRMVRRLGLLEVMWSVDSADSLGASWAQIIRNVTQGLRPGAIIELHENRGQTIRALSTVLARLRRRHLRPVSVLRLLAEDPPTVSQVLRGEAACVPAGRVAALTRGAD